MKKSRFLKFVGIGVSAFMLSFCLFGTAFAASNSGTTKQTISAHLEDGSGNNYAGVIYHVGSGWPYDDVKIAATVGGNDGTYFSEYGSIHAPGTSGTYYISIPRQYSLMGAGTYTNSATQSGSDTGYGYCEATRYSDSGKKTDIALNEYLTITQ
jgi:hypothetical protein